MAKIDNDEIVEAAIGLLQTEGIDALSLTAIAKALGVTQPALYYHLDGIEDVWRGVGLAIRRSLRASLNEAIAGRAGEEAVRALADTWRAFALDSPAAYRSTDRYPVQGDAELEAVVSDVLASLEHGLRGFSLSDDDCRDAALALRSTLHGFVSFELSDGTPLCDEVSETFARVIGLNIAALQSLAPVPTTSTHA